MSLLLAGTGCQQAPVPLSEPPRRSFDPSLLVAGEVDIERLADTEDCVSCHEDVGSHWMSSAHAHSSFDNPWYRASVDAFRAVRGNENSRFCAGCHDPLLLLSGDIDEPVEPEDELAYAGITCLLCHSIEEARTDGNGSFSLTAAEVIIPDPAVPSEVEAHRARLAMPALRTAELCGSCHRSFTGPQMGNPNQLAGIDDLADWQSSSAGGGVTDRHVSAEPQRCQGCHMQAVEPELGDMAGLIDQSVASHRWAASHSAMGRQLDDARQLEAVSEALRGAITVDLPGVWLDGVQHDSSEPVPVKGGQEMILDLVLENARTGHRFPGGARDMHDAWVEVEVLDGSGTILGSSSRAEDAQQDVFVLRATVLDDEGDPEALHRVHRFRAPAFDRTLPADEARLVRYRMTLPSSLKPPLEVRAKVLHRKHRLAFQQEACRDSLSERGMAFARGAAERGKAALDACERQPISTIANASIWLGDGTGQRSAEGGAARPALARLLSYGRALLQDRSEHAGRARARLERALELARRADDPASQGEVQLLLARLATLQGRSELALRHADEAERHWGARPAVERARGRAHASVWRWAEAAAAFEKVAAASPGDWSAWRDLARAKGSLSDDEGALRAAERGLQLAPRQEDLLRSRALALQGLRDPEATEARTRWLAHRRPDAQPSLLAACEKRWAQCALDRQPVPEYGLRPPPTKRFHARAEAR